MSLDLKSYRGTRDLYPLDMQLRRYIFDGWRFVVESYGYQEYMAPLIEPTATYSAKSGEEIVNEQTYSFSDRGGRNISIRPEMTPSIARMIAARRQETALPARLYSIANFMRYERPQHGREREFWQLNFDLFGVDGVEADIEIIALSYDILRHFSAMPDMFTIKVNDRKLTNYLMLDYLALTDNQSQKIIKLLDRYDKLDKLKFNDLASEILNDQTKLEKLESLISVNTLDDLPDSVKNNDITNDLRLVLDSLSKLGISNARYDIRLMRGFDYYTGIVFEVFDEAPENRRSMFGGGRYDGLVGLFGVEPLATVGAAPGETMFIEFLKAHDLVPEISAKIENYLIPMTDDLVAVQKIASQLRCQGVLLAVDLTRRSHNKMIKAAIKNGAKNLLFIGDSEIEANKITTKDVSSGEQTSLTLEQFCNRYAKEA